MAYQGYLGMRGTGDWSNTAIREDSWLNVLLRMYPNGKTKLTGILSMTGDRPIKTKFHHWSTYTFPIRQSTVTGVYTDVLSTAYTGSGSAGDTLYIKMSAEHVGYFANGYLGVGILDGESTVLRRVQCTATPVVNGASSYLTVKLLDDDGAGSAGTNSLNLADILKQYGNVNEEGADIPEALSYEPTNLVNVCGIVRTPLKITGTEYVVNDMKVNVQSYEELKANALEFHGVDIENLIIYSRYDATSTGTDGKPAFTPMGIIEFVEDNAPTNVQDYKLITTFQGYDYTAKTWVQAGDIFLNAFMELVNRWGEGGDKVAICGNGVVLAINTLAQVNGQYIINEKITAYGLRVMEWVTPFGNLDLMTHPLLNHNETDRHMMIVFNTKNIKFATLRPTKFISDPRREEKLSLGKDAVIEEFITEFTLELSNAPEWGIAYGLGKDNDQT